MVTLGLVALDTTIVATVVPQIVRDLGDFSQIGWVFSIYLLAQTVTIPLYGRLADSFGRKPVLVVGIVCFLFGSGLCAATWNMTSLVVFRAVQGVGAGAIVSTVNTVAGDLYELRSRGKVQGWLGSVWAVSAVVAPLLGGSIAEHVSWRWIFIINLPVGAVALLLLTRNLRECVEPTEKRQVDYAGSALIVLSAGLLMLGLLQGGVRWSWGSISSAAVFAGALLVGLGAVLVERRAAEPVMPPCLWARRLTAGSYGATFLAGVLIIGVSAFLPTWAQAVLGMTPIQSGLLLGVMALTWPVASTLASQVYLRVGFRDTAIGGALVATAGTSVLAGTGVESSAWPPVLGCSLLGIGLGLWTTSLLVGLQSTVGWGDRGVITGGQCSRARWGRALGPRHSALLPILSSRESCVHRPFISRRHFPTPSMVSARCWARTRLTRRNGF